MQIKLKRNTVVGQLIRRIKREDYSKPPNPKLNTEFITVSLYGDSLLGEALKGMVTVS